MNRKEILKAGAQLTMGDRQKQYGDPVDNMTAMADLWAAYLTHRLGTPVFLSPEDGAQMMVLAKVARTFYGTSGPKPDTYIDEAAYAAMAGECALRSTLIK